MVSVAESKYGRPTSGPASARDMQSCPTLSRDEEYELAGLIATGDPEARNRLVEANLRLVMKIGREFRGRGLELDDVIGEGNLGLIRAAARFDPSHGVRFSTYAAYWIRERILAALNNAIGIIRLPHNVRRLLIKWRRAEAMLCQQQDHVPTFEEVASVLDLSPAQKSLVASAQAANKTKLMSSFDGNWDYQTVDEIGDPEASSEDSMELNEEWIVVRRRMEHLDDRERTVLALRYGLGGGESLTHQEIGRRCGVSRQRARRIELLAIRKLGGGQTRFNDAR